MHRPQIAVIPANAGIDRDPDTLKIKMDFRFRGNDAAQ
jgi:hypothetical protein